MAPGKENKVQGKCTKWSKTEMLVPVLSTPMLEYVRLSEKISIVYLPVNVPTATEINQHKEHKVGLIVQTLKQKDSENTCLIVPVFGDHYSKTQEIRSLTGRCACVACLRRSVAEAEKQGVKGIDHIQRCYNSPILLNIFEQVAHRAT